MGAENKLINGTGLSIAYNDLKAKIDDIPVEKGSGQNSIQAPGSNASGMYAQALGWKSLATGIGAHAEGSYAMQMEMVNEQMVTQNIPTTASGTASHAEGKASQATAEASHAEGTQTEASANNSHAEGNKTTASGQNSHAEGNGTTASGNNSHAEGQNTIASGLRSHAHGYATIANHADQTVFGQQNVADPSSAASTERGNYVEIVGNGSGGTRSNARTLDWSGNEVLAGSLTIGGDEQLTKAQLQTMKSLDGRIGSTTMGTTATTVTGAIAEHEGDLSVLNSTIDAVEDEALAAFPEVATGPADVVTVTDGANDIPLKTLTVAIEPKQDLHGYDKPWVGGAGKNKYPIAVGEDNWSNNANGTHSNNDGELVINCLSSNAYSGVFSSGTQRELIRGQSGATTVSFDIKGSVAATILIYNAEQAITTSYTRKTVTIPANSSSNMSFYGNGNEMTIYVKNMAITYDGSADYEPYSNICPISGWDEATVTRTGKNLLDMASNVNNYAINEAGVPTALNGWNYSQLIYVSAGSSYTFSFVNADAGTNTWSRRIHAYDVYGNWLNQVAAISSTPNANVKYRLTFTAPDGAKYVRVSYPALQSNEVQLELGSTATDYEPYVADTLTIPIQSISGSTVYGGTVTVNEDGTGTLVVDKHTVNLGDLTWTYTSPRFSTVLSGDIEPYATANDTSFTADAICSNYAITNRAHVIDVDHSFSIHNATSTYLTVHDSAYTTVADFTAAMAGVQVCYKLKTPQSYSLTATQLRTLLGTNNVWCDAGQMTMAYRQDTGLAIDAVKLPLEAGSAVGAVQSPGCVASGQYSQAFGTKYTDTITTASGMGSHAEGCGTEAKGTGTHAEGQLTYAYVGGAHAEGTRTKATGSSAHAEGNTTMASGISSHAEGSQTTASGIGSHAEGDHVTASGYVSHAEGYYTTASGMYSHAQGEYTIANHLNQMVFGEYNVADPSTASEDYHGTYVEIVGNGDYQTRSNARTLDWSGNEALSGDLTINKNGANEMTVGQELSDLKSAITNVNAVYPYEYSGIINPGYAQNAGTWKISVSIRHTILPIKPGSKIYIAAGSSAKPEFAVLTQYTKPADGDTVHYSAAEGWKQVISVNKDATTEVLTAPDDAVWLYINLGASPEFARTPIKLEIDGYDYIKSIIENINNAKLDSNNNAENITAVRNSAIDYSFEAPIYATANNWKLVAETGLCSSDSDYKMLKFSVTAGKMYKIVSDHLCQFQSSASVPSSGTPNIVGKTYGTGTFYLIAPVGATYLIVSTTKENSNAVVYQPMDYMDAYPPVKIRIMQHNIGKMNKGQPLDGASQYLTEENYEEIIGNYKNFFGTYQPDIIGMEEFVAQRNIPTSGSPISVDLIDTLYNRLYPNVSYPTNDQVTSKSAILSKYPILDYKRESISCSAVYGGETITSSVWVVHGHIRIGTHNVAYCVAPLMNDDDREKGMALRAAVLPNILDLMADDDYAIFMTDANNGGATRSTTSIDASASEGDSLHTIAVNKGYESAMGSYFPWQKTWESSGSTPYIGAIDNIYYKNNGKIVFNNFRVLSDDAEDLVSDHIPVYADFTLL